MRLSSCYGIAFLLALGVHSTSSLDLSSVSDLWSNIKSTKLNKTAVEAHDFHERLEEIEKLVEAKLSHISVNQTAVKAMIEKLSHKVRDHVMKTGDDVEEVNENAHVAESGDLFESDIKMTSAQLDSLYPKEGAVQKRQAMGEWYVGVPWKIFHYSFHKSLAPHAKAVALIAMKYWQRNTCLDFAENNTAIPRVNIHQGTGCWAYVGQVGFDRPQGLSLGAGCDTVTIASHEIGHSMGFWHEQKRHDRDDFVTVLTANIRKHRLKDFDKEDSSTNENYGLPYDYGSIMHYSGQSDSVNGKPTIIAKIKQYQDTMGSPIISFRDISAMNSLYNCKARCPAATSAQCRNGGFPHPRNCAICLCPSGYGGPLCADRPAGCGSYLAATDKLQTFTGTVGNGKLVVQDEFVYCNWRITAPAGKRIQATITRYLKNSCNPGCKFGGVEMKWRPDQTLTGSRYCCPADVKETVTSASTVLPIIAYNRYGKETFTISYKAI